MKRLQRHKSDPSCFLTSTMAADNYIGKDAIPIETRADWLSDDRRNIRCDDVSGDQNLYKLFLKFKIFWYWKMQESAELKGSLNLREDPSWHYIKGVTTVLPRFVPIDGLESLPLRRRDIDFSYRARVRAKESRLAHHPASTTVFRDVQGSSRRVGNVEKMQEDIRRSRVQIVSVWVRFRWGRWF